MQRGQSANGLELCKTYLQNQDHTIQREKRGGGKRQMQPLYKGKKKASTHGFSPDGGLDPQMYLHTNTGSVSSPDPAGVDCEYTLTHIHTCTLCLCSQSSVT